MRSLKKLFIALLALTLVATACSSDPETVANPPEDDPAGTEGGSDGSGSSPGSGITITTDEVTSETSEPIAFTLSEGSPNDIVEQVDPAPVVEGEPITDDRVAAVVERLPELVGEPNDEQDFNLPVEGPPPPQAATLIDTPFPPDTDADLPDAANGPLEVLRIQPEGSVDLAPFVSITFNQPMVPIGTLGQLAEADVPATLTPDIPGRWEWIGTRTLRFESDSELIDRLPMATTYSVEIPAGTESASGEVLAEAVSWTFETPPPQVQSVSPQGESLDLETIFVVEFDQRIDSESAFETVSLQSNGSDFPIRLATADEVDADEHASRRVERATEGRWLAFLPSTPLPTNAPLEIVVGPNVPSAEGPNTSPDEHRTLASTYPPLRINEWNCRNCQPLQQFNINFTNPLDLAAFDESLVTVEPAIPGMVIDAGWNSIRIRGATTGQTDYRVTVDGSITDQFGQTLGDDQSHTFEVGSADPALGEFEGRGLVVLDPFADNPALVLPTINHDQLRVVVHAVEPSDWEQFNTYRNNLWDNANAPAPGDRLGEIVVDIDSEDDMLSFTDIELGEFLSGDHGQIVVTVAPTGRLANLDRDDDLWWQNRPKTVWAQATNIGLDAFATHDEIVVWTTALDSGAPLEGVTVELLARGIGVTQTLITGADGTARAELTSTNNGSIVATNGDDTAWMATGLSRENISDEVRWYVVDDRGIYRPGETVRVKGWVRSMTLTGETQLEQADPESTVSWTVFGPRGNELAVGDSAVSPLSGFDLEFDIPEGSNLGGALIEFNLRGQGRTFHDFQIQEFRRPEFEVTARNETPGPHFAGEPATVAVEAAFFSGGALPNSPVEWRVGTTAATYNPPNWDGFTFGRWIPWWYGSFGDFDEIGFGQEAQFEFFEGTTDATGTHYLEIGFANDEVTGPSTITAEATVSDVNRQAGSSSTSLLVHSGQNYVGLASDQTFVRRGEALDVSAIVTDIDGAPVLGVDFDVVAELLVWKRIEGEWVEVVSESQTCAQTSGTEPVDCSFDTEVGGRYRISSVVSDENGGRNRTELTRWVSGGAGRPSTQVERQEAELVPDKQNYEPGDTAEILVQSPFGAAEGLLLIQRNTIVEERRFAIEEDTTVLSIPIEDDHIPGLDIRVELTGTAPRLDNNGEELDGAPDRPAFASGQMLLRIPPTSRTLEVVATPATDALEPGSDTSVDVVVTDAAGEPVEDAEVLLVVVDEAVLSLTDFQLADPIETFYSDLQNWMNTAQLRELIFLTRSDLLLPTITPQSGDALDGVTAEASVADFASDEEAMEDESAESGDAGGDSIDVRTNFDALAVYEPELRTDADGATTVDFTLPDNLTRYRVMVVAVDGAEDFGSGEANITARLPLQVRPSAPRFLNFGDEFELPVVVQNQTDEDMEVDVVLEATNLEIDGSGGVVVTVPANDRVEVRFPVRAAEAGTARVRVAGASGDAADAATVELPVYTPATSEAFATYGVVDSGTVTQPLLGPTDVWPQFGGLEINTSSTALSALTDAVIYVNEYQYRSSDAAASQILSISALRDVLEAFDSDGLPAPAELDQSVNDSIEALVGMQNFDGGFPFWSRGRESQPFNTVHVAHALWAARDAGFDVPQDTYSSVFAYLRDIEQFYPNGYSETTRDTISAYAIYVRELNGGGPNAKAAELFERAGDRLSLDALAWLLPSLTSEVHRDAVLREFSNRTTETAAGATFVNNFSDDDFVLLHSNRRTDGIVLGALISEAPDSDLIPKVVEGLLAGQTNGRWSNLQENTFILLALNDFFDAFESVDPNFVAQVWLGGRFAAEHTYEGRSTDQNQALVPTSVLVEQGDTNIVIRKEGDGRLYYRLGLDYAPVDLDLDPVDRGFVVQRLYEAVDDEGDVWQDDDGVWHVKAGAEVRVTLTMVADSRRTHVALVDPLPAGLEILNPAFATTESIETDQSSNTYWWWQWFNHQNLRDDRAEAFTNRLWAGSYEYSYVARATTPGTFVVPPTTAEEMFHPETFGRSSTDTLIVE